MRLHVRLPQRYLLFSFLIVLFAGAPATGHARENSGKLLPRGYGKYEIWQQDIFRIKFTREGEDAVPPKDINGNHIPDFVEDVATQLQVAQYIFHVLYKFPHPFDSPRYKDVRYIDVTIRDISALRGASGLAFDAVGLRPDTSGIVDHIPDSELPRVPVVNIAISSSITPQKNLTPAHEYFHVIQNSMTRIKNAWFHEGMAAWSEDVLGIRTRTTAPPLQMLQSLREDSTFSKKVFNSTYKASSLVWGPLAKLCPEASIPFPENDPVLATIYSDGTPVVQDTVAYGARIMLRTLENLGQLEEIPFKRFAYEKWSVATQRREENNIFIVEALMEAAAAICPQETMSVYQAAP